MARGQGGPGATPPAVGLEYTRGTGPTYPTDLFSTSAISSGLQEAVTTFNETGGPIVLEGVADPLGTGATATVTPKPNAAGTFDIGASFLVPIVTSLPASPQAGQIVYNSASGNLALYDGTTWKTVALT